jgi:hypothetical protein
MRTVWVVLLGVVALGQAPKDAQWRAGAAGSYGSRQIVGKVTLAGQKFESDAETKGPFGKLNPNEFGVLPVLLVIDNQGDQSLLLEGIEVLYLTPDGQKVEPTPASEVRYLNAPRRPSVAPRLPIPRRAKKNPLEEPEIEARAFVAKAIVPGDSASGFFYFQVRHQRGAQLFVSRIREGTAGKELFFVEIPLDDAAR